MTLEQIEQRLSALKEEQDKLTAELERLKSEQAEVKGWRAEHGEEYFHLSQMGNIIASTEIHHPVDDSFFNIGNYYRTKELAEQDAKELALRGRVRQLRDALCEGYRFMPNKRNYLVYYSYDFECYKSDFLIGTEDIGTIWFDTKEHAQKACDILNADLSTR